MNSNQSRLSQRKTKEMVKTLIKRSEDNFENKQTRTRSQQSKKLIEKMEQKLEQDLEMPTNPNVDQVRNNNPLLKNVDTKSNYSKLSHSKSDKSLVSNSALSNYVRSLKGELEKERKAKNQALDILKKLKKDNKISENIDNLF